MTTSNQTARLTAVGTAPVRWYPVSDGPGVGRRIADEPWVRCTAPAETTYDNGAEESDPALGRNMPAIRYIGLGARGYRRARLLSEADSGHVVWETVPAGVSCSGLHRFSQRLDVAAWVSSSTCLLVAYEEGRYYQVTAAGLQVWQSIQTPRTLREIVDVVGRRSNAVDPGLQTAIGRFLLSAHALGVVGISSASPEVAGVER